MILSKASHDLNRLLDYLMEVKNLPSDRLYAVAVQHDPGHDRVNKTNPRAFCYVDRAYPSEINCTKAIEFLPPEARVGVLFHELGHIFLDAFHDDASEVDVDAWCLLTVPEANYVYRDTPYVISEKAYMKRRVAKSLQNVSSDFLRMLG
jgi:hypothetical protein